MGHEASVEEKHDKTILFTEMFKCEKEKTDNSCCTYVEWLSKASIKGIILTSSPNIFFVLKEHPLPYPTEYMQLRLHANYFLLH